MSQTDFQNKVALVTGSGRGIGRATALSFASRGASVVVNYVSNNEAAQGVVKQVIQAGGRAIAIKADVSNEQDVQRLIDATVAEFGQIDILVNNAGIVYDIENWQDTTAAEWDRTFGVHVLGGYYCAKYAAAHLQKSKGSIVNIASTNGYSEHYPESLAYNAAKAGIVSMTHDLAKALAPDVRVNAVAPGWVDTEMNASLSREYMAEQSAEIYLKRIAKPEELANAILFLASEEASFITSTILKVDGGHD